MTKKETSSHHSSSPALSDLINPPKFSPNLLNLDQNSSYNNILPDENNYKVKIEFKEEESEPVEVYRLNLDFLENILKNDASYQQNHIPIFLNSLNIQTHGAPPEYEAKKQKEKRIGRLTEEERRKKLENFKAKRKKRIRKIN